MEALARPCALVLTLTAPLLLAAAPGSGRASPSDDGPRAAACGAAAAAPSWPRLDIVVSGMRRLRGNITFTIYGDDPSRFLKRAGSLLVTRVPIEDALVEGCVVVSRPGWYAIAIYHDENDNHHFDRNFLGLPIEGYGFSNDAPTLLGPPRYEAARIMISAGTRRIAIHLRY